MKFRIDRSAAMEAVKTCAAVIRGGSTLPILSCTLVEAKGEEVSFLCSDLDRWIECRVPATIEKEGSAALNARLLAAIFSKGEASEVSVHVDDKLRAKVRCGESSYNFPSLPRAEFPDMPTDNRLQDVEMDSADWLTASRAVAWAASTDPARYTMNGTLLTEEDGNLLLVATDGARLSKSKTENQAFKADAIIPTDTMKVLNLIANGDDPLKLSVGASMIFAECGNSKAASKLVEGNYPHYRQVIPRRQGQANLTLVRIPSRAFIEAIERVSLMLDPNRPGVVLEITEDKVHLSFKGTENASSAVVAAEMKGPGLKITLGAQKLAEPFRNWESDVIEMELDDETSPVMLRNERSEYVLMPIRTGA